MTSNCDDNKNIPKHMLWNLWTNVAVRGASDAASGFKYVLTPKDVAYDIDSNVDSTLSEMVRKHVAKSVFGYAAFPAGQVGRTLAPVNHIDMFFHPHPDATNVFDAILESRQRQSAVVVAWGMKMSTATAEVRPHVVALFH